MKRVIKIIAFVLLIVVVVGTFFFLWNKSRVKEVKYEEITPALRTLEKKIIIAGNVEPRNEIALKPQISGIITQIFKEPGQEIKVGDVIAKVQVIPDIAQLNSAESRLNVALISLDQAEQEHERNKKLFQSGVIAKETYENYHVALLKAQEDVQNAQDDIQIIKEGISKNTEKYSNTQIKATISGMILDVPVKVGNSVIQANNFNDGTTIANIADMSDLLFVGNVDETEVGMITEGNEINLMIGAMQNAGLKATLEYIAPKATVENGTRIFEIKAAVNKNRQNTFIRSGYSANGEVITAKKENVLSVPESSLEFVNDSAFVYVVNSDKSSKNHYLKKPVVIGISDGIFVEIVSGITAEDKIRGNEIINK